MIFIVRLNLRIIAAAVPGMLVCILASQGAAALLLADDPSFGESSITVDTDTGLAWLHLRHSPRIPATDFDGLPSTFADWRLASAEEVDGLLEHFGFDQRDGQPRPEMSLLVDSFIQRFGTTILAGPIVTGTIGVTSTSAGADSSGNPLGLFLGVTRILRRPGGPVDVLVYGLEAGNTRRTDVASELWLVKSVAVPEPATAMSGLLLLLSASGLRLRRKRELYRN